METTEGTTDGAKGEGQVGREVDVETTGGEADEEVKAGDGERQARKESGV